VDHDDLARGAAGYIQFDAIGVGLDRSLKGGQSVFGGHVARAAMCDDQRRRAVE
jgi:hypothetical protein